MVTIKNVYSHFCELKFPTTEFFRLRLWNNGDITELYYGDPESSKGLVKNNEKDFFRREIYRNRKTIIKKYLSEFNACHDFILFDFLKSSIHDDAFKTELKNRCLFNIHEQPINSVDQLYEVFHSFGCPIKYLSTNENPQKNTIVVDTSSGKIVVELVRDRRIEICSLDGSFSDHAMLLWVIVSLFWKLMEHKQELQDIGIIGEDYSDSDILEFLRV